MSSNQGPDDSNLSPYRPPENPVPYTPAGALTPAWNLRPPGDPEAEGLLEYWRILTGRKWLLAMFGLGGAAIGLSLGLFMPKTYRAHASLEIQGRNDKFLNLQSLDPVASDYSPVEIETQVGLLQNRSVTEHTLQKMMPSGSGGSSRNFARKVALQMAAESLQAQSSERTRIVDLSCESTDPNVAADFLNTLASEFIDEGIESRWNSTQRISTWLATQLQGMKKDLETSQHELLNYARDSALVFANDDKDTVAEQKLREIEVELSAAQADRIVKQSKKELVSVRPPESIPDVLNDASLRASQTTLADLRRQLADLSSSYMPEHYKVKHVQAQISEMETTLQKERQNVVRRIYSEYDEARRREELLVSAYNAQAKQVMEQAPTAVEYGMRKREVEASKQLYDGLLQQLREAALGSAMQASAIRIAEPARPNPEPARPMPVMYTALGFASSLFFGCVFAVVRHQTDPHFYEPGDAAAFLSVPELGAIPSASAYVSRDGAIRDRKLFRLSKPIKLRVVLTPSANRKARSGVNFGRPPLDRLELVTWQRKPSLLAESFRATLASLMFAGDDAGVLVITSPSAREGKTTTTTNLAIALAETKRRVLLIDGDMRRPRQHDILEVSNSWGLSDALQESNPIESYPLEGLTRETSIPNLWTLPSGPGVVSASNLLYSPRLAQLLDRAKKAFDLILIDTPPILDLPDARILGQAASGVILVLRAGRTTRETAMAARQRLAQDNTRVIGTILNNWNPQGGAYKHYYKRYWKHLRAEAAG
jgi:polysaccharide biosynthesis transport protein